MELSGSIAKNLTKLRKREGLSIGSLAEKTGISTAAISQIEQGKGNPTISTISKLASVFTHGTPYYFQYIYIFAFKGLCFF